MSKDKRSKTFEFILYDDDKFKFHTCLAYYKSKYMYAYIYHDEDYKADGELKKPHYHLLIRLDNQRTLSSIQYEFSMFFDNVNLVECINDVSASVRYLIHADNPEKAQYNRNLIHSNFNIDKYFKTALDTNDKLDIIFEYIDNVPTKCSIPALIRFCQEKGLNTVLRQYYPMIKDYVYFSNK